MLLHAYKTVKQDYWYNSRMESVQEFHPERIPRQGERNAWLLTGAAVAAYLLLWRLSAASLLMLIMVAFLLVSAIFISLSNWIDRHTVLTLQAEGITFRNGLRTVSLNWAEIEKLSVLPDRWGARVRVAGKSALITFRMLSEVNFQGKLRGQMGFAEGEAILQRILRSSGLQEIKTGEKGRYYARS